MDTLGGLSPDNKILEQAKKRTAFIKLFEDTLKKKGEGVPVIEYNLPFPKEDFLRFLATEQNVLLHGSSNTSLEILEPRQANDSSKASGNKKAVYGVVDPVLPIFYAIKDLSKINGVVESGAMPNPQTGELKYKFRIPKEALDAKPWTNGVIYIFDRSQFTPEIEDDGEPSGEWTSGLAIKPIAKLEVNPDDFRFLNEVEGYTKAPQEPKREIFPIGHTFTIEGEETTYTVEKVEMASEVGKQFGLKINRVVPIYWIKGMSPGRQGGYHPKTDAVYMFENNTDDTTLEHELVHVVEYHLPQTPQLVSLWERAKEVITESSFTGGFFAFNFMKNVHEFIAEGKTRPAFIEALKKEGLYEEFLKETNYIFD